MAGRKTGIFQGVCMNVNSIILTTHLPPCPFEKFIELQERIRLLRLEQKVPQVLIFAAHPPCFSLGFRDRGNPEKNFKTAITRTDTGGITCNAIPIYATIHGGEVTYHGPGILGCYTIFGHLPLKAEDYYRLYQRMVKDLLSFWKIKGVLRPPRADVWIDTRKIASIGFQYRIHPRLTAYGVNINVGGDLTPFSYIYPCGERDPNLGVTSLEREIGYSPPLETVVLKLINSLGAFLPRLHIRRIQPQQFFEELKIEKPLG